MTVDERIVARLGALGWTQKELAVRAGVNPSYVAHLCGGKRQVSPKFLRRVAEVLELDPDLLIVESGLLTQPGSMRHKQAVVLAKERGMALDAAGHLQEAVS